METDRIDVRGGEIIWDTLRYYDESVSPFESGPSEDLFAVNYPLQQITIDVGWYQNTFCIYVIALNDEEGWVHPLDKIFCDNYPELYIKLQETIDKWVK